MPERIPTAGGPLAENIASLVEVTNEIEQTEERLKQLKLRRRDLETTILPGLFIDAGVKKVQLPNGTVANKSMVAEGVLPKEEPARAAAIQWLDANGYADLINVKIEAKFGRGEREQALGWYNRLRAANSAVVEIKEDVHFKTLGKIAKDRVVGGEPVPLETLGVTVLPMVKLTRRGERNDQT